MRPVCCSPALQPPLSSSEAESTAAILKALADPARLRIVSLVGATDEICACELEEPLGLTQPTVSHHLRVLVEAGLLQREQRGRWAFFKVAEERLAEISRVLRPSIDAVSNPA